MSFAERYPSAARSELRSLLVWPMLGCLSGAVVLLVVGVQNAGSPGGWVALVGGLGCLALVVGLYRLHEWARWCAFSLSLAFLVLLLLNIVSGGLTGHWASFVHKLVIGALHLGLVLYLPSPAATRAFALARSRWVPRPRHAGRGPGDETVA